MRLSSHVCQTSSHQDAWLGIEGPLPKWLSHMVASWCWLLAGGLRSPMFESFHKSEWVSQSTRSEGASAMQKLFFLWPSLESQAASSPSCLSTHVQQLSSAWEETTQGMKIRRWGSWEAFWRLATTHPFLSAFTSLSATQSFFLRPPLLLQWPFAQCPFWGL